MSEILTVPNIQNLPDSNTCLYNYLQYFTTQLNAEL